MLVLGSRVRARVKVGAKAKAKVSVSPGHDGEPLGVGLTQIRLGLVRPHARDDLPWHAPLLRAVLHVVDAELPVHHRAAPQKRDALQLQTDRNSSLSGLC